MICSCEAVWVEEGEVEAVSESEAELLLAIARGERARGREGGQEEGR